MSIVHVNNEYTIFFVDNALEIFAHYHIVGLVRLLVFIAHAYVICVSIGNKMKHRKNATKIFNIIDNGQEKKSGFLLVVNLPRCSF